MSKPKLNPDLQGEGSYTAAKHYDDATRNFIKAGKVSEAAKNAVPKNAKEEREMLEAEEKWRAHAKPDPNQIRMNEPHKTTDHVPKKRPGASPR